MCLDAANPPNDYNPVDGHVPILYPCHGQGGNQNFLYMKRKEIRHLASRNDLCLSYSRKMGKNKDWILALQVCVGNVQKHDIPAFEHQWIYDQVTKNLKNIRYKVCLTREANNELAAMECQVGNPDQRWIWLNSDQVKQEIKLG